MRDAADRGFAVAVIDEAVAGFSQESHDATLASLRGGFAAMIPTVADTVAMLDELAGRSTARAAAE